MEPILQTENRIDQPVALDVIIPMYNEAEIIPQLLKRLDKTFSPKACKIHKIGRINYCFIDDGSTDNSDLLIKDHLSSRANIKIIQFSRNFGHQAAVSAGIFQSNADVAAVIDADLQDPPELILEMLHKWREGYEVVYAQRVNRKENAFKKFAYWLFYRLYHLMSPIEIPLDSGDFCLISQRVINALNQLPESLRFPRGLRSWVGFSQIGLKYDRPERAAGETKYSFRRLYQLATDGMASLSTRPLKFVQFMALVYFLLSTSTIPFLFEYWFEENTTDSLLLLILFFTIFSHGLVLLCIAIMGSYVGRTYLEVKRRPNHIIRDIHVYERKDHE